MNTTHKFSLQVCNNIKKLLPVVQTIEINTDLDYHGFSWYLSEKLGLDSTPYSNVGLWHGWLHWQIKSVEELTLGVKRLKYLLPTQTEVSFFKEHNLDDVEAVGVPFIYVDEDMKNIPRYEKSLLVMPPHTLENSKSSWGEESYIEDILKISEHFDTLVFCIHQNSVEEKLWTQTLQKYNIPWIIGANAKDKNSLLRMKIIFHSFEYMTSNSFGSHIAYAAYCNVKVFMYSNYIPLRRESFEELPYYKERSLLLEQLLKVYSQQYVKDRYPFFFVKHNQAKVMREWAVEVLGEKHKLSFEDLASKLNIVKSKEQRAKELKKLEFSKNFNHFYSFVENLNKLEKKYMIFGAGTVGKTIASLLNFEIVGFLESHAKDNIIMANNYNIYTPQELKKLEYDYIIISVLGREEEIIETLEMKYYISRDKIITFDEI